MDKINVLLLTEYNKDITVPEYVVTMPADKDMDDWKEADIIFVDKNLSDEEYEVVIGTEKPHHVYVSERLTDVVKRSGLSKKLLSKDIKSEDIADFIESDARYFYKKPYGEKYSLNNITVSRNFAGKVKFEGNGGVVLNGDFGDRLSQALYFRNNIPVEAGREIDFWVEYEKTGNIEISLEIISYVYGQVSEVYDIREYNESELADIIRFGRFEKSVHVFVSVKAKGKGRLKFIALHDRFSRGCNGCFLIGGERYVTSKREEVFAYFEPGDLKPPLNIYFSGYKTREGFEGYNLMKKLGSPFLLLAEARLEGGAFYMGDAEYEELFTDVIRKYMDLLGFKGSDVIISGLSMGSFGALYYGCDIRPHAVLLGKPLASVGNIALNEKRFRPGGFPTSIDILNKHSGGTDNVSISEMNKRMWDKYESTDWSESKFVVAYMIEDDYDSTAYDEMITRLNDSGATVYGKGIHGRHNDNTSGIVNWFTGQFEEIMTKDYSRSMKK